jgi:hypothetical protein
MRRAAGKDLSPSGRSPGGLEFEIEREVMAALHDTRRVGLVHWYVSLSSSWLEVEPPMRRLLMLRIHQWIAERVLTPRRQDGSPAREDLKPGGALVQSLFALVPPRELDDWRGWIRLVVVELKQALRWPLAKRNEAWAHWLFLIPYREQVVRAPEYKVGMPWNRSGLLAGHQSRRARGGPERWNKASAR